MKLKSRMYFVFGVIAFLLSGCANVANSFYDSEQLFKDARNSEIGKKIDDVLDTYHPSFKPKIVPIGNNEVEYLIGLPEYCYYALIVNSATSEVTDWRYISEQHKCKKEKFYSGPW